MIYYINVVNEKVVPPMYHVATIHSPGVEVSGGVWLTARGIAVEKSKGHTFYTKGVVASASSSTGYVWASFNTPVEVYQLSTGTWVVRSVANGSTLDNIAFVPRKK